MPMTVELVSPEDIVFTGEADMVVVRTTDGEIAFQSGHVPFIGNLAIAAARVYLTDGTVQAIAVHRGFVEISHDNISILSDVAELSQSIDVARAERSRTSAEESLRADADDEDAQAALRRAEVRLETAAA